MRKTVPMRIGQLWDDFLREKPAVARGLAQARAVEAWPRIVGPAIAIHTVSVTVEKNIMVVKMSSAAARSELFMRRAELRDAVNNAVGMRAVNEVIVK